jgi:hypothetical protein
MKSLPTLLSTADLNNLLDGFPSNAQVSRTDSSVVVKAPKGQRVLSAISSDGNQWHVMAVEGLINIKLSA